MFSPSHAIHRCLGPSWIQTESTQASVTRGKDSCDQCRCEHHRPAVLARLGLRGPFPGDAFDLATSKLRRHPAVGNGSIPIGKDHVRTTLEWPGATTHWPQWCTWRVVQSSAGHMRLLFPILPLFIGAVYGCARSPNEAA